VIRLDVAAALRHPSPMDNGAMLGRRLMRGCERAALATSMLGAPYASLVLVAADFDATPLLLLSDLARHSRDLAFEPRLSLLFDGTAGYPNRLGGPRLTVLGRAEPAADPRLLSRFTARHPSSAGYARFADFRLYRVVVERGHLVAGFGRIEWIEGAALLWPGDYRSFADEEAALVAQLSQTHAAAVRRYGKRAARGGGARWLVSGLDPEGADLRSEDAALRLDFAAPAATAVAARDALLRIIEETSQEKD
jgi:hypothetical protein